MRKPFWTVTNDRDRPEILSTPAESRSAGKSLTLNYLRLLRIAIAIGLLGFILGSTQVFFVPHQRIEHLVVFGGDLSDLGKGLYRYPRLQIATPRVEFHHVY